MNFTDRELKCADCGEMFVFTAGEQEFYREKEFKNDPKRCKQCKGPGTRRVRAETAVNCSECGRSTTVPFKPTQGRPVMCRTCFTNRRKAPHIVAA
ncbi:zinc-ribbon domain containing protein [Telmatobacter sp. DSM 110680]|uniref:Zinc-ribbon domain containing protein n=1 Tax=Telmatobacter sp. DSM 110680 TaxID=3036704 RepID=A0AAU7DJK7_9BACT